MSEKIKALLEEQQFATFNEWVNRASLFLTSHPQYNGQEFRAVCFDAKGRLCRIGRDFMRARDEKTFPRLLGLAGSDR